VQAQVDSGQRLGATSNELAEIKNPQGQGSRLRGSERDLETGVNFLREGARPSPPLICQFIDQIRTQGFAGRVRFWHSRVSRAATSPHERTGLGRKTSLAGGPCRMRTSATHYSRPWVNQKACMAEKNDCSLATARDRCQCGNTAPAHG
jgi:hypothetical protein